MALTDGVATKERLREVLVDTEFKAEFLLTAKTKRASSTDKCDPSRFRLSECLLRAACCSSGVAQRSRARRLRSRRLRPRLQRQPLCHLQVQRLRERVRTVA